MRIEVCKPYYAISDGTGLLRMPDGRSAFKIYYLSIVGRDNPKKYEWEQSSLSKGAFEHHFVTGEHEGIGFVTAFPHVTKVFRFSPHIETLLDVKVFDTATMRLRKHSQSEGYCEFACYAEAVIAAKEYQAWAESATVDGYLAFVCQESDFSVKVNNKLKQYWTSKLPQHLTA